MRAHLATLKQMTEAEGRDFSALTISYKAPLYDAGIPDRDGNAPQLLRQRPTTSPATSVRSPRSACTS